MKYITEKHIRFSLLGRVCTCLFFALFVVAITLFFLEEIPGEWSAFVLIALLFVFICAVICFKKFSRCIICGASVRSAEGCIGLEQAEELTKMVSFTKMFGKQRFGRSNHWRVQYYYCKNCGYRQVVSVTNSRMA